MYQSCTKNLIDVLKQIDISTFFFLFFFFFLDETQWGVSNMGAFIDGYSRYNKIIERDAQFQNTPDSGLFQNARMSPSSLRYYGFGLQNGNYTVKLQFSEITYPDPPPFTWQSTGRRVFDIFIQVSTI